MTAGGQDIGSELARLVGEAAPHDPPVTPIDRLFVAVEGDLLGVAAARLAAHGVPVFPCVPGGKRPLTSHGFHDATADARQVALWWKRWPSANIGVPTGAASRMDVVDVDLKRTGSGYPAFARARQAGLVDGWLALVRTPSGGMHVFYPTARGRPQPSWQATSVCVDFRGEGGYVIVPPSIGMTANGARAAYTLVGARRPAPAPIDAKALRDLLEPPSERLLVRAPVVKGSPDAGRLAAWMAALSESERNLGLFWATCRLAEAGLPATDAEAALAPAARQAGLPAREVASTIRSAYRVAGGQSGRHAPRSEPPRTRGGTRFEHRMST